MARARAFRRPAGRARHSIADPRVEQRVGDIDEKVDQHVDEREQQDHRLDGRIIARQHGIDGEPAEARNGEDAFGDDHAADQQRDAEPDHGDDRHGGVLQRVLEQHLDLDLSLGARGADVVLAHHVEHAGARHARDQRDVDDRERDRGQDQALQEAAEAVADALIALHRNPVELDREQVDQRIADHEHRHREAEHREAHHDLVDDGALLVGGEHAERHRDGRPRW